MSSLANTHRSAALFLALSILAACATTDSSANASDSSNAKALEQAMRDAVAPATAEEIAAAERSDPLTRANFWAQEFQKDQANPETAFSFMQSLRAIGSYERAVEVGAGILPFHPDNYQILLEVGRSLLANNQPEAAAQALVRSADFSPVTEAAPLAALGLAFDRMARHDQAQEAYREALKREPTRVSTLSNYGLSLALSGRLTQAEEQLRLASGSPGADARIRQNLALVLGLQGKFDEMVEVDPNIPRRTVEANRKVLRQMIIPARSYESLAEADPIDMTQPISLPPSPVEVMPDVKEVEVSETAMTEPAAEEMIAPEPNETALDGGTTRTEKPKLRSRLRGTTG
ncbi:MAG: hypothetical protein AAGH90_05335 [Pseudomonadota bacterium]